MSIGSVHIPLEVPDAGERNDIPSHRLPLNALSICQNMLRDNRGRLVMRPGYLRLVTTGPGGRIVGLHYYRTAAAADRTIAVNRTQIWSFDGATWTNRTNTALNGATTDEPRFAVFPEGTPIVYNVIIVNNQAADQVWNGSAATCSDLGGAPPVFADVKVLGNRVLGLVRPNTLRISAYNDSATWPSTLAIILADSGDIMVGMERINRTTVGIYGDSSQWVARAQQGTFPIRVEWVGSYPGPISARSIVKHGDRNYWLAEDGNVYAFDGVQVIPVGYAMRRFVLDNLNYLNRTMSHGLFVSRFETIWWFFPGASDSAPKLGIYYNLRTGEMGRLAFGEVTASAPWRTVTLITWNDLASLTWDNIAASYPSWDSFTGTANKAEILGDSSGNVHMVGLGTGGDNGNAISGIWEYGLIPAGGLERNFHPLAYEAFFRRTANPTTLSTSIGVTNTLMTDRSLTAAANIDLQTDQRNDINLAGLELINRFVTVRHSVSTTTSGVEFLGGILHGNREGLTVGPTT